MSPEEMLEFARTNEVEFIDLRHADMLGRISHLTLPVAELNAQTIRDGFPARGALPACRLVPDADTAFIDPFCQHTTLALLCDLKDSATGNDDPDDPRGVARRAERNFQSAGIAEEVRLAAEVQFFIFDQVHYEQGMHAAGYHVDSREGSWRRGRDEGDNLGTQIRVGEGERSLPPADSLHNLRSEIVAALASCGIPPRGHGHGGATGGHAFIALPPAAPTRLADHIVTCKYVVRNVAARHGKVATFMPQPLFGEHGCGLPIRLALTRAQRSQLADETTGALTDLGRQVTNGWLGHAGSLMALTCPTTNSFRRLAANPLRAEVGQDSSATLIRLAASGMALPDAGLAFHAADASCNPYVALSALLLAAGDGARRSTIPAGGRAASLPDSLEKALAALEADREYLLAGEAFSVAFLERWIACKRGEVAALRTRPHPYEFCLYFDV